MIQIIGFLICACLAVKLLEMTANPALRRESGMPKDSVVLALFIGWASVFGFTLWLYAQGSAFPDTSAPQATGEVGEQLACLDAAQTAEQIAACTK